jgi:hypothetical protein
MANIARDSIYKRENPDIYIRAVIVRKDLYTMGIFDDAKPSHEASFGERICGDSQASKKGDLGDFFSGSGTKVREATWGERISGASTARHDSSFGDDVTGETETTWGSWK